MNKSFSLFLMSVILCLICSCYDTENNYGDHLVDSVFRNVTTDTSTVLVSTMRIDSLETSGQSILLLGEYTHALWGTTLAQSYIAYECPSYGTDAESTVALDSLVLTLSHSGYFLGDTTKALRFNVHLLTEKVVLHDNGYLYNKDKFSYDPEPIGSYEYKPEPGDTSRFEIRLSDTLGEDLLTRFHARDPFVTETDWFEDYFRGITLIPETGSNHSIIAYAVRDTFATLTLRYHEMDAFETAHELMFTPKTSTQFNHLEQDYSQTPLDPSQTVIPSEDMENKGLLMAGIGWYTTLEFPHLNEILQMGERVDIQQAILQVYPDFDTYGGYNLLPDSTYLYIADENNVVTDAVKDYLGEEVQSGTLVEDELFWENTCYYFDVTSFMQDELGTLGQNKHKLQLVFDATDYTSTVKNLTIYDQKGKKPIVLQLTYSIYETY
ncbi:DUF4270 family protein [Parabacteroides sp. PF5-6]|uniref:DUF4270 family protein n=1 Tax=Parabacteroides sp. PF5-6 TaxID=1742403 RepID=UPI0024072072|nr:DUF4270 family protein [Parabacteroides sp. PF5-6]MDF9829433.1 hypothetical protein [Parabacteroides sp. PF5-6]